MAADASWMDLRHILWRKKLAESGEFRQLGVNFPPRSMEP
jgi:hypothetical protein